jgi:hypothetical protein
MFHLVNLKAADVLSISLPELTPVSPNPAWHTITIRHRRLRPCKLVLITPNLSLHPCIHRLQT